MEELIVPTYFLCPISIEIMEDPVIVPTGISYDRQNIEKWLFSKKNASCPVTKIDISNCELIPNHTLRRLIQSWCTINASHGVQRFPTPKPLATKAQILNILQHSSSLLERVRKLRVIASDNESNRYCMTSAGVEGFLVSVLLQDADKPTKEEAVAVLALLHEPESSLTALAKDQFGDFVNSMVEIMRRGSDEARGNAVVLMESVLGFADLGKIFSLQSDVFVQTVAVLRDQLSAQAVKSAMKMLIRVCPWGSNRAKAVDTNAVHVLVDLLANTSARRTCELALVLMDILCQCSEGRVALTSHAAGLAVLSKKMLRVSAVGDDRAMRVIASVARASPQRSCLEEMLEVGVVVKLCLILQVDCGEKVKKMAYETLKLHARSWKESQCIPPKFARSYPL